MKLAVFWDVLVWWILTDVLEEPSAFIVRVLSKLLVENLG
jgi:hypothetical protein